VVALTKQVGVAVALGHTIWETAVGAAVSWVQVAVDPEMVALSITPLDDVAPRAKHAGVVADVGQTMEVSCKTPEIEPSDEVDHVVPLVVMAAAAPEELYPTAMHALVVQPTPSISVSAAGKVATDQPVLVFTIPVASGEAAGDVELAGIWPTARQMTGPVFGQNNPSAVAVELG
jgi:hypothetical protein